MVIESWSVIEKTTGRKICECGEERDAIALVLLDPNHRIYKKNKYILDQIIDITTEYDKKLYGQIGLPESIISPLPTYKDKLPESKEKPFFV